MREEGDSRGRRGNRKLLGGDKLTHIFSHMWTLDLNTHTHARTHPRRHARTQAGRRGTISGMEGVRGREGHGKGNGANVGN